MESKSKVQYASIEQPFGCEHPIVHCPICGKAAVEFHEEGEGNISPCEHLAFIYLDNISEFAYTSEEFNKKTEGIDVNRYANFKNFLNATPYNNYLLALEITHGGMACGPVWDTEVYGFDYGTLKKAE